MSAVRIPTQLARSWFGIAALAGLLSLGLPWKHTLQFGLTYGYWTTGFCYNSYDSEGWATTYCDPWYMPFPGTGSKIVTVTGAEHPVRVMLLLAVVALVAGYRRGSATLLKAGAGVAALGLFSFGFTGMSGQLCYAVGLAALVMALHRDGVLALRRAPARLSPSLS